MCVGQLAGGRIAGGHKRQAIGTIDGVFIFKIDQQHLADLCLPALDGAFDLVGLEQRCIGMHGDFQLAAGGLVDVGGKLREVFRMEVGSRVGRRQVPFCLRKG